MLVELTKKASLQKLHICGQFTHEELRQLEGEGWRITWQEKSKPKRSRKTEQHTKNGIPIGRVV